MDLKEFDSLSVKDRCRLVDDATAWFCVFSEIIMNKNFALFFCDAKVHIEVIKIVLGNYYDRIVKSDDKAMSVLEKINLGDSVYLITSCEFISCRVDSETGFMECVILIGGYLKLLLMVYMIMEMVGILRLRVFQWKFRYMILENIYF